METPVINFKYFESPGNFGHFLDEETACEICGHHTKCFDGSAFIGENDIDAICQDCLANGKVLEYDVVTCQGDTTELRTQLQVLHRGASAGEIDDMVKEKTTGLETTTPPLITWQDWEWPCADGDYCLFIGYGSKQLYNELSGNKQGFDLFADSIYYSQEDDTDTEALWDESMSSKRINNNADAEKLSVLFYVFKSLHSNKIVTIWDMD